MFPSPAARVEPYGARRSAATIDGIESSGFSVLTISGSLRRRSFNALLLRAAEAVGPAGVSFEHYDGLGDIPHFSQDIEAELTPPAAIEFRDRIRGADCVLISTPEYNGTMPGTLKNALDWASRPSGESAFTDKPAAVIGASPGRYGAERAQADIRKVLSAMGAETLDAALPVPRVHEKFDDTGALQDEEIRTRLAELVAALVALTGEPVPPAAESAEYSLACQRMAV